MKKIFFKRIFIIIILNSTIATGLQAQTNKVTTLNKLDTTGDSNNISEQIFVPFGKLKKRYVTSSMSTVYGTDIEKNFTLNAGNTLYGRLAGLNVLQGGSASEPGASVPNLNIRGINTFGEASTSPLIIVDGFLCNGIGTANGFMQLLPEEIESISVLKDAAATAVYGSRAANGVILVTTKAGKEGPLKVTFTTKQGFNQAQYIPKFLGSYNYAVLYNEALQNDGLPAKYSDADLYAYQNHTDPLYHPDVNWYNEILRPTSPVSSYDLTFNGGDKTVKYFVMLNALNSQGLYKKFGDMDPESSNSKFSRYNFRTNVDLTLSKNLSAEFKIAGSLEQINNPNDYNTSSTFNAISLLPPNAIPVYNANGTFAGTSAYSNPVGNLLSTGSAQSNARTILSSLKFTEKLDMITKGLSASAAISINNYFKSGSRKTKSYARYVPFKTASGVDSATLVASSATTSLSGTEQTLDQYRNYIIQAFLNYNRTFGKSEITAMAMFNADNITLYGPSGDPTNPTANSTDPYKHNNVSGRLNYVYNGKYIAEFSMAYMGSDPFPKGKQYGFFPAGSIGWVASNENFLKNSKAVNFLKFRASYGLVGNDVVVPLGLSTRYSLYNQTYGGAGYFFGTGNAGAGGLAEAILANPNLTWEKEKVTNIGFDATLLKHFNLSFDYFNRDRYDILVSANSTLPSYLGVTSPSLNQGKSNNKGFEVALRYSNKTKKALQYFVETNLSYSTNKIIFNAEALNLNTQLYKTGKIINQPFVYKAIGLFTAADIDKRVIDPKSVPAPLNETVRAGDVKYQDVGGPAGVPDGIIDGNDLQPLGKSGIPNLIVGLHSGISYNGFDLDVVFQGVTGNTVYLGGSYFNAFQNNGNISPIALGRWTPATADDATYPRLTSKINNQNNFAGSTYWQRDGSFIKLRSAEIGYTFPTKISDKIKIGTFRIFANGTNLFSLDHIPYGDPESLTGYPVTRTVTIGAKIQL
ncbi:MAG: TonB-dependent receptor [Pedobacter sp.]|nr:TonB-dependent receptor [Chitinophagaceae bacterium]